MDYKDINNKLKNHMMNIDLEKLTFNDLQTYANITKTISDIEKPGYEQLISNIAMQGFGSNGSENKPEIKEEAKK